MQKEKLQFTISGGREFLRARDTIVRSEPGVAAKVNGGIKSNPRENTRRDSGEGFPVNVETSLLEWLDAHRKGVILEVQASWNAADRESAKTIGQRSCKSWEVWPT